MTDKDSEELQTGPKFGKPTDLLANERTFLAWIRTNLAIMAFGFVVEKFSFFIHQMSVFMGAKPELQPLNSHQSTIQTYSSIFGITLVSIGTVLCFFAFLQYKKTERQINSDNYRSISIIYTFLMALGFLIGIFLIIYLVISSKFLTE